MANPLASVTNLSVFYGDAQALWDVSFEVYEGEVFSIIGSNGSGKSTILRTLAGLIRPSSGRVEFEGNRISCSARIHKQKGEPCDSPFGMLSRRLKTQPAIGESVAAAVVVEF